LSNTITEKGLEIMLRRQGDGQSDPSIGQTLETEVDSLDAAPIDKGLSPLDDGRVAMKI